MNCILSSLVAVIISALKEFKEQIGQTQEMPNTTDLHSHKTLLSLTKKENPKWLN